MTLHCNDSCEAALISTLFDPPETLAGTYAAVASLRGDLDFQSSRMTSGMEDQSESLAGAQRSEYEGNSHDSSLTPCDSSEAVRPFFRP